MWYTLRISSNADRDFVSAARDLLSASSRGLILVTGGFYVVWQVVVAAAYPGDEIWRIALIPLAVVVGCGLGLWLLRRRFAIAQLVWLAGLTAGTALAAHQYGDPYIGFIYALLPLLAAVTLGWQAALAGEILVIGIVGWLVSSSGLPPMKIAHMPRGSSLAGLWPVYSAGLRFAHS